MNTIRLIALALPMTILMACGGGGGGGGGGTVATPMNMPDPMNPPTNMPPPTTGDPNTPPAPTFISATLPDWAIPNVTTAQSAVSGTAPTSMTETQIISAIQTRATAADYFEFSDLSGATGTSTVSLTRSGDGISYSGDVPDIGMLTFSRTGIADLSLVDETNFNFETQAVMDEGGATMIQSRSAAEQSDGTQLAFKSYGGWLDNSVFGVVLLDVTENATTANRFASFSFGAKSGTRPTGSAAFQYAGVMVGSTNTGDILQGDLIVTYVTADANILDQVQFLNVKNLNNGNAVFFSGDGGVTNDLRFNDVRLETDGTFEASGIRGSFYGNGHEQIGGVFNRSNVVGAFGGVKQ